MIDPATTLPASQGLPHEDKDDHCSKFDEVALYFA
jgi:hypothetical protein